jgi:hypothetical protein
MRSWMIRRTAAPLAMALAAAAGVLVPARRAVVAAESGIQPFYLEQTTSAEMSETGAFVPHSTRTVARRADGVTAVIEGLGPTFSGRMRDVMSPDGQTVTVWQDTHLKTTWPAGNAQAAMLSEQLTHVSPDCHPTRIGYDADGQRSSANETFVRFDSSHDQRVVVVQSRSSGYIFTSWKAPALACETLYYTSQRIQPDGSLVLKLETTTTHLELGEPDPRLFAIDADYAESKPSAGLTALIRWSVGDALPAKEEADLRREGDEMDRRYQPPAPKR